MLITNFDKARHLDALRACLIELQDYESELDPRIPPGAAIVDEFIPRLLRNCRLSDGKILMAEVDGEVAGFVAVLSKVRNEEPEEGDYEFGLITDLVVLKRFRNKGFGRQLLEAAEVFAKSRGVRWLKIGMLAGNQAAGKLYSSMGYSTIYVERQKDLSSS